MRGPQYPPLRHWLSGALALLCALPLAAASQRMDLDRDWQFRTDPGDGLRLGWNSTIPSATETVVVPHTWNIGELHDYSGVAWYFRALARPSIPSGGHVELHFGATFYSARVWLNGEELGSHAGGFTAYSFDITQRLREKNLLAVRVDNRPGIATIPGIAARGGPTAHYDWWAYGGLVRDVWLTITGPVWIDHQSIRSAHEAGRWVVRDRISLGGTLEQGTPVVLRLRAVGPDNRTEAETSRVSRLARGQTETQLSLDLIDPKLWSIDHPDMYRMIAEVSGPDGKLLDQDRAAFGVRILEIRDLHLLINGERVRLTGIARHEDSPWEGLAETSGTIRHDYDDMIGLHTTISRPVHYPQSPLVLDYADRHGILLIPEIPVWQFSEAQLSDPRVLQLARQQIREMIEEAGNHPSILGWSVANESATGTPGGIAYFRAMRELIRQIDPGRPVSFADDALPKLERADQSAAQDADFLMMNEYYGSWHGPAEALIPALDKVHRLFPDKLVIISEMGFAGIFATDPREADLLRIRTLQEQLPVLAARDWIGAAILWCYQDYKSPRNLWPGQTEGYVEHGLVDEARQRKPSYAVWERLNRPVQMSAHWTGLAGQVPEGVELVITPHTEKDLPYHPLRDYRLVWSVLDAQGNALAGGERQLAELIKPTTVTDSLRAAPSDVRAHSGATLTPDGLRAPGGSHSLRYRLTASLLSSNGAVAASETLEWHQPSGVGQR